MPNPSTWIFDMDGTLTEAVHDFQLIRRELGLGPEDPILDSIRNAEPDKARQMNHRLNEIEWELAALARPAAGIHEFLLGLKEGNVRLGILTRNRHDIALETLKRAGLSEFFQEDWIVELLLDDLIDWNNWQWERCVGCQPPQSLVSFEVRW